MGLPGRGQNHVMWQDDFSKLVGGAISAGELSDRFQGALLGISLLPTALSPIRSVLGSTTWGAAALGSTALDCHTELDWRRSQLQQAVDCSLDQTRSFVFAPNSWTVDLAQLQNPAFLLPAYVPVLLRYHDSWRRRFDRLMLLKSQIDHLQQEEMTVDGNEAIAQLLMLGDLLEAISLDTSQLLSQSSSQLDWIARLADCATRYQRAPQIHVRYKQLLSFINVRLSPDVTTCTDYSMGNDKIQQSFAVGLTRALAHPESYILAVQGSSGYSATCTAMADNIAQSVAQSMEKPSSNWIADFLAGLLSGAFSGSRRLPTLWQIRPGLDDSQELAARLFSLWAGGFSAVGLPD